MSFNIFGPSSKNDIRVSYIDPDRGLIKNVSIYDANVYASLNPGSVFILETRDRVRYLTINEVNNLTPNDITPDQNASGTCDGIRGLVPGETITYPSGGTLIACGGKSVTFDGRGGIPITSGGTGGTKVTAGGVPLMVGKNEVKCDAKGGSIITIGGTGGEQVYVGAEPLEINGQPVLSGADGGIPLKTNSVGGFESKTGGTNGCVGGIYISGGGGVGAAANPIFGSDGSLLACDLVRGGFGYRFPPKATIYDTCRRGSGAVLKLSIGEVAPTVQYFDQEEDFEIYNLTPPGGELSGYGFRFGPNGENLGEWDPNLFATFAQDPIAIEIQKYQDFLAQGINPFWHTRKEKPLSVTFGDKTSNVVHNVTDAGYRKLREDNGDTTDHGWSDWMNRYAVAPVPESNVPGSDYAGRVATMEWEENFPYTGEYVFRGMADNIGKLYLDNELLIETGQFGGLNARNIEPKNTVKKTVQEGVHRIKIDLLNIPIKEKPKLQVSGSQDLTITYHGLNQGSTKTVSGEKSYAIRTEGESRTAGRRVRNNGKEIQFDDDISNGFDENASLRIESTSPGVSAKFNGDGTQLIVKGRGDVSLKFSWDDNPKTKGLSVGTLKIGNGQKVSWITRQIGKKGSDRKTINVGGEDSKEVIGKGGFIVSGDKKKVQMRDGHGDDINSTFSISSSTNNARFSDDGKRLITDGPGNIKLKLEWNDDPKTAGVAVDKIEVGGVILDQRGKKGSDTKTLTIDAPKTVSASNQSQISGRVFNTADYVDKADRKLWRTNVYGRGGFLNEYGICPFNTTKPLEGNPYSGTHVIRWEHVDFPVDGNYLIDIEVDDSVKLFIGNSAGAGAADIGNGLTSVEQGGDEVIIEKNGFVEGTSKGTGKSSYTKFFKKGSYRIRAELYQKPGGRFAFSNEGGSSSNISARFVRRGSELYMVVDGSGTADIEFSLKMDDNPRVAGDSLGKVKIGKGANDSVVLSRTRSGKGYKEKETITGSATFEAGKEYLVQVFGASSGVGEPRVKNNSIQFLDTGGSDTNGELFIKKIKNQQQGSIKGINPMALAINIVLAADQQEVISARSFNQNPMGAAFTIDAPLPPIPQEPPLQAEGRCPNNPIWSTRFSNGQEKWWPVKFTDAWSDFMNRFAISPIPPLSSPNSDGGGGITYKNTWNVEIPYDGFYGIKGAGDNAGRILIDNTEVYTLKGFKNTSPEITKVRLSAGLHTVTVEVENFPQRKYKTIQKQVFSTQNWAKPSSGIELTDVDFRITTSADYGNGVEMVGLFKTKKEKNGKQLNEINSQKIEIGKVYDVIFTSPQSKESDGGIRLRNAGENVIQMEEATDLDYSDLVITATKGKFYEINGNRCKYVIGSPKVEQETKTQNGVTYSGPKVFRYNHPAWSNFMNTNNVSPYLPPLGEENPNILGTKTFTWSNVDFFESGRYILQLQGDNVATVYINGKVVATSRAFRGDLTPTYVEVSKGKYEVKVELENIPTDKNIFNDNPTGFALKILKDVRIVTETAPWTINPIGVSAIMIPPPCPKEIKGRGVVTSCEILDPGNSYPQPVGTGYPVTLVLEAVIPDSKGINYSPEDRVLVNGTPLVPVLGPFGTVERVIVPTIGPLGPSGTVESVIPDNLYGFTEYPNITMPSKTGVGFRGRPMFTPVIVPEDVLPDQDILQVTDLVGLKQTGYVNGKPYYGSVFSKDGQLYAGIYETIGKLIPVYATLQESIDGQVTTRPSAILRQGTDITSNDPRLNIPGTPDNLI